MSRFVVKHPVTWADAKFAMLVVAALMIYGVGYAAAYRIALLFTRNSATICLVETVAPIAMQLLCVAAYSKKYTEKNYRVFSWIFVVLGWCWEALNLLGVLRVAFGFFNAAEETQIIRIANAGGPPLVTAAEIAVFAFVAYAVVRNKHIYDNYKMAMSVFITI